VRCSLPCFALPLLSRWPHSRAQHAQRDSQVPQAGDEAAPSNANAAQRAAKVGSVVVDAQRLDSPKAQHGPVCARLDAFMGYWGAAEYNWGWERAIGSV